MDRKGIWQNEEANFLIFEGEGALIPRAVLLKTLKCRSSRNFLDKAPLSLQVLIEEHCLENR